MRRNGTGAAAETGRKRLDPAMVGVVLVVVALLFLLAGLRLHAWTSRGQETRLMVLVNPWNRVDDADYSPRLTKLPNGLQVDRGCFKALERMLDDCRLAGNSPVVCSAYRSRETQQGLFDQKVRELLDAGTPAELAEATAARTVAYPGTSEHELGLAVDIVDIEYQLLDAEQENTATQRWLLENAWRYGFILRYPPNAREITGYDYEPWHYRYVGVAAAEQIQILGVTLEEYLAMFYTDTAEVVFES